MSNIPMSNIPTVSVLMAVYNTERYLPEAVESILQQTYQNFELIVIDDGSSDRSLQILQKYAEVDQRIHLISRENRGIPKTRNELVSLARGKFLAIMDSDDVALPDRLAQQVAFLEQHPEVVWVGGAFDLIDRKGRRLTRISLVEQDDDIRHLLQKGQVNFLHPTAMLRRQSVLQVGGYDEAFPLAEDLDLWLRLSQVGKLASIKEAVVQYRIHPTSTCDRSRGMPPVDVQKALDRAWRNGVIQEQVRATTICGWRPGVDRASQYEYMLRYGWWAFESRQRFAALEYGMQAIAVKPLALAGWKLLVCAAVKPLPGLS